MHVPLWNQACITPEEIRKTWRGGGVNGHHYFDNRLAETLITRFNACADIDAVNQLLTHTEPLVRSSNTDRRRGTRCLMKYFRGFASSFLKSLRLYDPAKGSAFSFVAKII